MQSGKTASIVALASAPPCIGRRKAGTRQCPDLPFTERGLSPIRSAWPGSTLEIGKPLVLAERCELGQLALRANEDTAGKEKRAAGSSPAARGCKKSINAR